MISKETLENLVKSVTKVYKMQKMLSTRVELDKENNVKVYVNLVVNQIL